MRGASPVTVPGSAEERALIAELYAEDFARFDYDPEDVPEDRVLAEKHLPPKPIPAQNPQKQALQKGIP